ncbi:MAG: tetratricopeptide repeat protein, partial [Candidatus Solibacter usitatus]|nr:tetratricopeptide repeat protein [Candidatus Solibacter usitatus]
DHLQFAERTGDAGQRAQAYEGIAGVLLRLERYPEALEYYEKTHAAGKALGNQVTVGYSLMNRAAVLWRLGRYAEAARFLDEASRLADQPGRLKSLAPSILAVRAEMALSRRSFSEAAALARRGLGVASSEYAKSNLQLVLGLALARSGSAREGRKWCEQALRTSEPLADPSSTSEARLALAEALLAAREPKAALEQARLAQEVFERTGQKESLWRLSLLQARANNQAAEPTRRAGEIMSQLSQSWGAQVLEKYLARPDIVDYRRER